jgi:IS1 family transposase
MTAIYTTHFVTKANGACMRELGRMNRKEKVMERVLKYWLRLWAVEE